MWPLELVATATDSPRYSPAGTFRKFGTDVYRISGTFCAVAFCCANAGAAHSTKAIADTDARQRFIGASRKFGRNLSFGRVTKIAGQYTKPHRNGRQLLASRAERVL